MEHSSEYLFRESIDNPFNSSKSRWHIAITATFPDRVTIANPNNTIAGRAQIDDLVETSEVPLLNHELGSVRIPSDIIEKIVEIVGVVEPTLNNLGANPFKP